MVRNFEQNQPVAFEPAETGGDAAALLREDIKAAARLPQPGRYGVRAMVFAGVASLFWIGIWCAYLWGYFGTRGLSGLEIQQYALFGAAILLPPLLFLAVAGAFGLAHRMGRMAEALQGATENLFVTDESVARSAARLGRAVRHELDALNAGLDGAYSRLRALETALENQIAAMDEAGARAEVRGEAIAARLTQETQRLESVSENLTEIASRATETMAGRAAQMKSTIETAEGTLKMAAQSLDVQAAGFRAAAQNAAEAPHTAAVELDAQAKKIESVSDAALQRAEFVLARQEKHRAAMSEMLTKLKEEGDQFEAALNQQRAAMETTVGALSGEAHRFETITGEAERHLEGIMSNAAQRAAQLTSAFSQEAERLKETSDGANTVLTSLVSTLRDAGSGAQTLIGESTAQAKHDANILVGEAMAECEKLLRVAGEISGEATKIRENLAKTVEEVERHLSRLPTVAQGEAQRIRQMVQAETNEMLDMSARAISTIQSRNAQPRPPQPQQPGTALVPATEGDGLKGLARKITQRPKKNPDLRSDTVGAAKTWEMKTLLAAVENNEPPARDLGNAAASAMGALQLALADMAVDLEAIGSESAPGNEDWKRYLAGDRAVFARKLASAIDDGAIDRITKLYREDERFHDAADSYLNEFEALLSRSRENDPGGLLTSSILSADTGKI
ncbi:MAG: hypothetical protein JSR25_07170, partial [Proteobacteria bacterium]|nr:hypothetical protein [Pseudomonadota bacterium]